MAKHTLNATIDADVAEWLKEYADQRGLSVSAAVNRLLATGITAVANPPGGNARFKDVLGFHQDALMSE